MLKLNLGRTLCRWLIGVLAGFISCSCAVAADQATADAAAQAAPQAGATAPAPQTTAGTGVQSDLALGEVVVTAYRQSLAVSLDAKRAATGSIDVIVAEDIADFPDLNLAEALQRVPGVSIARDAGEGRQISVRGLGPQFTRVRINGMEAMSANGGTDAAGGTNRDRSFDFNTFAAELFNNVTIRKTASAEIEEGSLGATVDLVTGRPFDYKGLTFATSIEGGYNDISDEVSPRVAVLISDTWADGKFGALFSGAYTERKLLDEGSSTVRWQQSDASAAGGACLAPMLPTTCFGALDPTYASAPSLDAVNRAFHPRIPRFDNYTHDQERLGLTGSVQWQPTDNMLFTLDGLYALYQSTRQEQFLEAPVFSTNGAAAINNVNPVAAEIDGHNSLVYGVFQDVDIRSEARFDELETKFTQVSLEGRQDFSEAWSLHEYVGFSEANHNNPVQTTLLFDHADVDGYSYDYRANDRIPLITYGGLDVTNPGTWTLTQIRLRPQSSLNDFTTGSIDLQFKANDALTFKMGPQYKKYVFKTTSEQRSNGTATGQEGVIPANVAATPIANYSRLTSLDDKGLNLPAGSVSTWLIPDINAANSLFGLKDESLWRVGPELALGSNFEVEEKDTGGYVQMDFNTTLWNHGLRGNIGVRYVQTDQTSEGFTFSSGVPVRSSVDNTYTNTLPSLNLVYELADNFLLRAGASKVMTRAGLASLNPGSAVSIAGNNKTVTAGNPRLEPFKADSYDLSFEWYFKPESIVALALFYKDIASFVQTVRFTDNFSNNPLGLPDSVALSTCGTAIPDPATCLADWQFNLPANTPGGPLKGFELSYQQPFKFLPPPFDNFGAILNYTYVESDIKLVDATGAVVLVTDLLGLSKNAYNATLYYENQRFGARISAAYRDNYLTTAPGRNGNDVEGTNETLNLDTQLSFNATEWLTFTLEALNLTDEFQDQWVQEDASRLSYYHHQGRQYFLGARLKF